MKIIKAILLSLVLLASPIFAASQPFRLVDNVLVNITPGTFEFSAVAIAERSSSMMLRIARQTSLTPTFWDSESILVNGEFYVSVDGGATFQFVCGFGSSGGIFVLPDLTESPATTITCDIPNGKNRQLRAVLHVNGGSLLTRIIVEEQN